MIAKRIIQRYSSTKNHRLKNSGSINKNLKSNY